MIYFLQDSGTHAIKIGYAISPVERAATLQTGNVSKLELLLEIDGDRRDEAGLHRRFANDRVAGEWFKPSPELLKLICVESAAKVSRRDPHADGIPVPDKMAVWLVTVAEETQWGSRTITFGAVTYSPRDIPDVHAGYHSLRGTGSAIYSIVSVTRAERIKLSEITVGDSISEQRPGYGSVVDWAWVDGAPIGYFKKPIWSDTNTGPAGL